MTPGRARAARIAASGIALAALAFGGHARATTALPDGPTIEVSDAPTAGDTVAPGSTIGVSGSGFTANTLIQLEICGAEGRSGSSDCAIDQAQVVASNAAGSFRGRLNLVIPPSPCPCVVRAISQTGTQSAAAPVDVPGAPTAHPGDGDVKAPALRRLDVEAVSLRGNDSWTTWLGAAPERTFEFDLVNTGSVAVNDVTVSIVAGPANDPTGFVTPVKVARMDLGERRHFVVPIQFPALSWGDQAVRATVNGTSQPTVFAATTSTHPWLLVIVPLVLLVQGLLLLARNIVRRRLQQPEPLPEIDPNAPVDDALICVVEVSEPDPAGDPAVTARVSHTMVVRSINAIQQMVLDALVVDDEGEPVDGQPVVNSITVLADADARVGAAYHACDTLCEWIEQAYAASEHPDARALTLRRHASPGGTSMPLASAGMGMVPLAVMVRAAHVRTGTSA